MHSPAHTPKRHFQISTGSTVAVPQNDVPKQMLVRGNDKAQYIVYCRNTTSRSTVQLYFESLNLLDRQHPEQPAPANA